MFPAFPTLSSTNFFQTMFVVKLIPLFWIILFSVQMKKKTYQFIQLRGHSNNTLHHWGEVANVIVNKCHIGDRFKVPTSVKEYGLICNSSITSKNWDGVQSCNFFCLVKISNDKSRASQLHHSQSDKHERQTTLQNGPLCILLNLDRQFLDLQNWDGHVLFSRLLTGFQTEFET